MVSPVLSLENLSKRFGAVCALDGLTLEVPPGAVGLLGPNGAGKTTLIKLLLGLVRADGGSATIAGFDPADGKERLELRRRVGYMPEGDCLHPAATAVGLAMTLGRLAGLSWADAMTRAHETLDYVGLDEARYREIGEYSTGMKQRLKLAQALVHDPPLLLLDEPTNGLDPRGRRHMLDLVRDLAFAQGKNVLLCSHLLPDVEKTCEYVVVLNRGRAVASGSLEDLTRADERSIRVRVEGESERLARELGEQGFSCSADGAGALRVGLRAESDADFVFAAAERCNTTVTTLEPVRTSLDEIFLDALRSEV